MQETPVDKIADVAREAVLVAGATVARLSSRVEKIADKSSGNDVLTTADAESEKIILNAISKNFPDHSIYSEEFGSNNLVSDYKWFIDPLDGSKHIVRGLPFFCVTLGVTFKDEVVLGMTYIPLLDQFFEARKGEGAFLNGKTIKVSPVTDLDKALIDAEFPSRNFKVEWSATDYANAFQDFEKVIKNIFRVRMIGSGPIGMAYTAMGGYDAYARFQPYSLEDVIAGYILIKEAGGVITDFNGEHLDIIKSAKGRFVGGNETLVEKIIKLKK